MILSNFTAWVQLTAAPQRAQLQSLAKCLTDACMPKISGTIARLQGRRTIQLVTNSFVENGLRMKSGFLEPKNDKRSSAGVLPSFDLSTFFEGAVSCTH